MIVQSDESNSAAMQQPAISEFPKTSLLKNSAQASSDIFSILSLWAEKNPDELRPMISNELGSICYVIEGCNFPFEALRTAEKKSLLKVKGMVSFSSCSKCGSHSLQAQLVCPDCKFQSLVKSDLLIHYECQHSGPIGEFRSPGRDSFFCPKCSKDLKRVGIDYGNPGIGFMCSNCAKVFQFPLVLNHCNAGHVCKIDELDLKSYPIYVIGDNAKELTRTLVDSRAIQDVLKNLRIDAETMFHQKGISGTNHLLPLLVTKQNGEKVAIEFIPEEPNIEQIILQLLLKSADLENTKIIIISRSAAVANQIRQIVNPKKVRVIEGSDFRFISEQIIGEIVA